jgi:type IV pilus assembly protein PilP
MAKKVKTTFLKKFLIVAIALVLIQVALIVFFRSQQEPTTFNESAQEALDQTAGISDRRADQAKIQMAVIAYKRDQGALPATLNDLKPKYLEVLPNDPDTQKPFSYRIDGDKFFVGESEQTKATPTAANGLTPGAEQTAFVYDSTGKRDPFRPFDIAPKQDDANKTVLERYDLGQLKLTAVLSGESPSATVELMDGKGFILKKGTKIGLNNGEVIDIQPTKIIVLETKIDFTGQKTQNSVELQLRTADQEARR